MPQRKVKLHIDAYYHVYNRGHNRGRIFVERENYRFFVHRMRNYLLASLEIVAYCLMPTHYHWLVRVEGENPARAMMRFSVSYTKAMNKRYRRTGSLFEGPYQAKHVGKDEYLTHLSRYIHLNPVRAGLVARPEDWELSSYREYIGLRNGTLPRPDIVLSQFPSREAYQAFVESDMFEDHEMITDLLFD